MSALPESYGRIKAAAELDRHRFERSAWKYKVATIAFGLVAAGAQMSDSTDLREGGALFGGAGIVLAGAAAIYNDRRRDQAGQSGYWPSQDSIRKIEWEQHTL
ncbi:MAG: hypothetical protein H6855_05655 [Rhodospirillales bacterium]|nr:hypothetical protein [Rhodospirillales bacterium]MCB9965547.1 hypothetical protein [Rhodospirillales bacterium]MCB9979788.1 hypothetical protein [Rhodospirillales bacterium]